MRLARTPAFDEESARFQLRFCCEECAHFDPRADRCAHEWPSELHRRDAAAPELPASMPGPMPRSMPRPMIDFCKEFELC